MQRANNPTSSMLSVKKVRFNFGGACGALVKGCCTDENALNSAMHASCPKREVDSVQNRQKHFDS